MNLTLYCSEHKKQTRNLQKVPDVLVCAKGKSRCRKKARIIKADNLSIGDNVEINGVSGIVEKFISKKGDLFVILEGREGEYPFEKRVIDISWRKVPLLPLSEIPRYEGELISSKSDFREEVFNLAMEGMESDEAVKRLSEKFEKSEVRAKANMRLVIWRLKRVGWTFYPSKGSKFLVLCGKGKVPEIGVRDD